MNGSYLFLFDWTTGYVISERGHNVIRKDLTQAISENNVVFLNTEKNSIQEKQNLTKMNDRKISLKMLKRSHKQHKSCEKMDKPKISVKRAKTSNV